MDGQSLPKYMRVCPHILFCHPEHREGSSPSGKQLFEVCPLFSYFEFSRLLFSPPSIPKNVPMNAQIFHDQAIARLRMGQFEQAADLLQQCTKLDPERVQAWFDLGRTLSMLGKEDKALIAFERILQIEPRHAEAQNARGIMFSHLGQREEAIACFSQAHALKPDYPAPLNNLGNEFFKQGEHENALHHFDCALALNPDYPNAWVGRGNALLLLDRVEESLASFDRALGAMPRDLDALNGRGNCLAFLKRYDESLTCFGQALEISPNDPGSFNNRGNVYKLMSQYDKALADYDHALNLGATGDELLTNKGNVLIRLGRPALALTCFREALAINPDNFRAILGTADSQRDLGHHEVAREFLVKEVLRHPDQLGLLSGALFHINYSTSLSPAEILAWHCRYGSMLEEPLKAGRKPHHNSRDPNRQLRVGFVSGDLRRHPVGYFMESTFKALAQSHNLKLYAYANQHRDDALSARIRPCFECWRDILREKDDHVADLIRADEIDILVDLSGHSTAHRLPVFARKPAPVQLTYLGYSGTTGLSTMDYILGNKWLMPEEEENWYTEAPWRMPDTQLCFTPPEFDVPVGPLPALRAGYVTFGNFNALHKMNDDTVACWSRLLQALPQSRLVLKALQFSGTEACTRVADRFRAHGIGPERLTLLKQSESHSTHMADYGKIDIALDPFPYNGTTTSMDALWMGVPVLTLRGDRYIGRVGASIMETVGMPEWIANNEDDFVERAVYLAGDPSTLAMLRRELRPRLLGSPLCDAPSFAFNLELALREMWRNWCRS